MGGGGGGGGGGGNALELIYFSIQTTIGSFDEDTSEIKEDWLLCL